MELYALDDDVCSSICSSLDITSLAALAQTSRRFAELVRGQSRIWKGVPTPFMSPVVHSQLPRFPHVCALLTRPADPRPCCSCVHPARLAGATRGRGVQAGRAAAVGTHVANQHRVRPWGCLWFVLSLLTPTMSA